MPARWAAGGDLQVPAAGPEAPPPPASHCPWAAGACLQQTVAGEEAALQSRTDIGSVVSDLGDCHPGAECWLVPAQDTFAEVRSGCFQQSFAACMPLHSYLGSLHGPQNLQPSCSSCGKATLGEAESQLHGSACSAEVAPPHTSMHGALAAWAARVMAAMGKLGQHCRRLRDFVKGRFERLRQGQHLWAIQLECCFTSNAEPKFRCAELASLL